MHMCNRIKLDGCSMQENKKIIAFDLLFVILFAQQLIRATIVATSRQLSLYRFGYGVRTQTFAPLYLNFNDAPHEVGSVGPKAK